MKDYRDQVEAAIRATVFHSPATYSWFGKASQPPNLAVKGALTPQAARDYLLFDLQSQLYNDFYRQGFAAPAREEAIGLPVMGVTPFVQELSAANSGTGYWQRGWEVGAVQDEGVVVRGRGLQLWVSPGDCLVPQGDSIAPGMSLSLRFPKEDLGISPGFYMALSNKELGEDDSKRLVRFYWNLTAEGAVRLMRIVTWMLNRAHSPFSLKVLNDPTQYVRCDAGVLYVRKSDYEALAEILAEIHSELVSCLKEGTPAFTKPLAKGIGLAEDTGQGGSFGLHRCGILADGMIRAYEQSKKSVDERLQIVEGCFTENGIDLEKPFLNRGSSDIYDFRPRYRRRTQLLHGGITSPRRVANSTAMLETAAEIGQRLAHEAVWFQDRCNWLGAEPMESGRSDRQLGATLGALGPEFYSGTSGVALFLAELHAATRDRAARRTALGAIRQALSRVDVVPSPSRLGLFTGWVGIALVAARLGILLEERELSQRATQLLRRLTHERLYKREFDLISGNAGAIAGLVVLRDILEDRLIMDVAVRLGDELLQTADNSDDAGYSWKSAISPNHRNLTGFSHGAAGVGYALLELFHATGDSKYRKGAELAFQYERHWFDAEAGNWPDFRESAGKGKRSKLPLSFATTWCHGAPGIALSRLRAYEILNDETCEAEAMTALQTTRRMIETALHSGIGDFSLCHGLAGNAEVLLYGSQTLGQEWAEESELALRVASAGIERHGARGRSWPCGTGAGETPSLMLGLAGIGYFYLRVHEMTTPSILILQREAFLGSPGSELRRPRRA